MTVVTSGTKHITENCSFQCKGAWTFSLKARGDGDKPCLIGL